VQTIDAAEGGVVGSAMLAATAVGVFASPKDAVAAWVERGAVFMPRPENRATYEALYALFVDVHDRLQAPFVELSRVAMRDP
jgi:ribulose kinase